MGWCIVVCWYNGRYYDLVACGYVSLRMRLENLMLNAGVVHGLNRYGMTVDNFVFSVMNIEKRVLKNLFYLLKSIIII